MRIKNQKDFWAGAMFFCFGVFFAGIGTNYKLGSAANMGPGYFPCALGVILIGLGIAIAVSGVSPRSRDEKVGRFSWSALLLILGPVVLFALLLNSLGLIVCLFMLVGISSLASHEFKWRATLINALVLAILSYVVFVWALKLQFPLWPVFFGD